MSIECKHGYLARACDRCEMEEEIERLWAFVAAWDAWSKLNEQHLWAEAEYLAMTAAREAVGPCS